MMKACLRCSRMFSTDEKFVRLCTTCHRYVTGQEAAFAPHRVLIPSSGIRGSHSEGRAPIRAELIHTIPNSPCRCLGTA